MSKISQSSEDALIRRLTQNLSTQPEIITGVGDDCAVIAKHETEHTLLKTDTIVESVHFLPEEDPERVGWKAAARVVSDFAAMGGKPEALLVTIILPPETELEWVEKLYLGLNAVADRFNCSIVGGETSSTASGSPKVVSISGTGTVAPHHLTLRSEAKPGDLIYVTGQLGGSIRGKHLDFTPRVKEANWLVTHYKPSAMMDLSDGIAKDLPRLANLSQCGYQIYPEKLPLNPNCTTNQALNDGEDYELLFSISKEKQESLNTEWNTLFSNLKLTHIGHLTENETNSLSGGWDHFTKGS